MAPEQVERNVVDVGVIFEMASTLDAAVAESLDVCFPWFWRMLLCTFVLEM